MDKQRQTAGETAKTNPAWGIVAVIGVMVAVTMGDSLIMAAIGTAMLAAGAWLGGYMDDIKTKTRTGKYTQLSAAAGEREAA